jgi:hypothetical protein
MLCPACGAKMEERACHATCRRCGYFEDCSDGMLPVLAPLPGRPAAAQPDSKRLRPPRSETAIADGEH